MKLLCVLLLVFSFRYASLEKAKQTCSLSPGELPLKWINMVDPCIEILKSQVKTEVKAAITYLAMGAYFARDTVNRPGFSKFFFDSASEERQHAIKIIEYLLMRGQLTSDVSHLLPLRLKTDRHEWTSGADALKHALDLETKVTRSINNIIRICENPPNNTMSNDYHLVDYLTGEFLDEQYKGERDLAGKLSTLNKLTSGYGAGLGEFLFDKKLLNGEV